MNNKILISVVLPVYNAENYLPDAIESILNQTYSNLELIIINDGSTDESLNIMKQWYEKDQRIKIISRENKGLIYSLNEGINIAKGEFIARMDADDISLPTRLEKQLAYLTQNQLDICGCHYFEINECGELSGLRLVPKNQDMITICLASAVPFAHPSVLIRKSFLEINRLYYGEGVAKYAEDLDLWIRMYSNKASFGNVNEILFKYRIVKNSLSRTKRNKIICDSKKLYSNYYKNQKNNIYESLNRLPMELNSFEQVWVCAAIIKLSSNGNIFRYKKILKRIPSHIKFTIFLREIYRLLRF